MTKIIRTPIRLTTPRNKYNAIKTACVDHRGKHIHDSRKEADYCRTLQVLLKEKRILDFERQVSIELLKGFEYRGKKERPITYVADFVIFKLGKTQYCDVKGYKTEVYKLKRKMFLNKIKNEPGAEFLEIF